VSHALGSARAALAGVRARSATRVPVSPKQAALRRVLAALLLPASLVPVVLLAPSLARAPATLGREVVHALAPAHPRRTVHREPPGPRHFLTGPARFEVDVLEGVAGGLTPQIGYSPFDEPAWAARAAAGPAGTAPIVMVARGRELLSASGQPIQTR
jgi:hypothetical protein